MTSVPFPLRLPACLAVFLILSACAGGGGGEPSTSFPDPGDADRSRGGTVTEGGGFTLFGGGEGSASSDGQTLMTSAPEQAGAVNGFLWRGAIDTLAFMPLASADPFGGILLTEWYAAPDAPDERFKVNVYVLSDTLRADGIRVAVFRQQRTASGWEDAPVAPETALQLENVILSRARQLRIAAAGSR